MRGPAHPESLRLRRPPGGRGPKSERRWSPRTDRTARETARKGPGCERLAPSARWERLAGGGRREVGSQTRPHLLPAAAGERWAAGSALVSPVRARRWTPGRKVAYRTPLRGKVSLTLGNWEPVRSQSPAAGLLSSEFGGPLLRRPEQVGAQVQLVVFSTTPGPPSLAGAGLWSVTARGPRVCSWHLSSSFPSCSLSPKAVRLCPGHPALCLMELLATGA